MSGGESRYVTTLGSLAVFKNTKGVLADVKDDEKEGFQESNHQTQHETLLIVMGRRAHMRNRGDEPMTYKGSVTASNFESKNPSTCHAAGCSQSRLFRRHRSELPMLFIA